MLLNYIPVFSAMLVLGMGILLLVMINRQPIKKMTGNDVSELVVEGLSAFSKRTVSIIMQFICYIVILLAIIPYALGNIVHWKQLLAFTIGASVMVIGSFFCLRWIPRLIPKIVDASSGHVLDGITLLYNISKAVGFLIIGSIIAVMIGCYMVLGVECLLGYGVGVMVTSFFLRIGGAIYKTSAQITESIGTTENDSPNDQRNPATFGTMIGDYIGGMIGFSADIISSFIFAIIACLLTVYSFYNMGIITQDVAEYLYQWPMYIVSIALGISIVSYLYGRVRLLFKYSNILLETAYFSVILNIGATYWLLKWVKVPTDIINSIGYNGQLNLFMPYIIGAIGTILIAKTTDYYTGAQYKPTKKLINIIESGPVLPFLTGMKNGFYSNSIFIVVLSGIVLLSYQFSGLLGVSFAALGMLCVVTVFVSMRVFACLATNVNRLTMLVVNEDSVMNKNTKEMDILGDTASALGNGFSTGVAIFSTLSLLLPLIRYTNMDTNGYINLDLVVLIGGVVGIILTFIFSGSLLKGVKTTTVSGVKEVDRQFKEIPYLQLGKAYPDMVKASEKQTIKALKALTTPGLILLLVPIIMGYIFGVKILIGLILGVFIMGISQAFYWANMGDSIEKSKQHIKLGKLGGKESNNYTHIEHAQHIAMLYNGTLSPSTNIMIKFVTMMGILLMLMIIG